MRLSFGTWPKTFDWLIFLAPLILLGAGMAVIYSLTPAEGGKITLVLSQGIYALVGFLAMILLTFLDYRTLKAAAPALYGVGVVLLILVLAVGSIQFGAKRWIDLGPFQLQPSELMKPIILVTLAWFFASRDEINLADIAASLIIMIIPVFLVIRQPDFGTAILLVLASLPIFLLSKIRREQWLGLLGLVILVLPLIFFSLKPYQKARLETFLDPERDPFGAGYNVRQSLIAIGSGGLTGRGLGQGSQSTLQFIPVAHTDFIFAGIAEAAGFFGSSALIIIFALLVFRAVKVGLVSQDRFGRLLSFGFACLWLFSCFINMGMNLGLVPVTGIPLPFVSFGGSSLITNFAIAGILQSIYLRHRKISFR